MLKREETETDDNIKKKGSELKSSMKENNLLTWRLNIQNKR